VIRKAIMMDAKDNVATALTDLKQGEKINVTLDAFSTDVALTQDVEFAHKFALRDIAKGEEITKYGLPIGRAMEDIKAGDWVHVHNCRSHRWGFHNETYGLKA
jgi:altronate dehydratase small subunit